MNGTAFSLNTYYANTHRARIFNAILFVLLVLLIIAVPLPFGSVEAAPIFGIQVIASLSFLVWICKLAFCSNKAQRQQFHQFYAEEKKSYQRSPFFHRWSLLAGLLRLMTFGLWPRTYKTSNVLNGSKPRLPRMTFYSILGFPVKNTGLESIALILLAFLFLQMVPFPHSLVKILSPLTADLYASVAGVVGTSTANHPVSLDSFGTFSKLLEYLAYFMIFLVIVNASPFRSFFRVILFTFLLSAGFQAVYGLIEFLSGHHHIFTYKKTVNLEYATGTFINRNHYAAYLELAIPIILGVLFSKIGGVSRIKGPLMTRISRSMEGDAGKIFFFLFLLATMFFALIFSLSRGGILFTTVACILFFFLSAFSGRKFTRSFFLTLLLTALLAGGIWYGAQPLIKRFTKITKEFTAERSRVQLYQDTLRIFMAFPVTGSGAGTFMQVFPMFQSVSIPKTFYRYAHNDYLQLIAETGITGVFILFFLILAGWARIRSILERKSRAVPLLQMGIFCGLLACALHSLTEFGLQIPAVATTFTILAALFWRTPGGDGSIL